MTAAGEFVGEEHHAVEVFTTVTCSCGWRYSSDSEGACWAAAGEHQESFVDQYGRSS